MFYFIPFWFFAGESRVLCTLIIPIGRLVFLVFAPRLGRMGTRRALLITLAFLGVAGVTWLLGQMAVMRKGCLSQQ
jgi:ABC-type Na+ efflux pump permease subunit